MQPPGDSSFLFLTHGHPWPLQALGTPCA